jgi:hypothetical protein
MTRSLPNRNLDLRYEHFTMHAARDLVVASSLKKKRKSLDEVCPGFLYGCPLAGDIEFRAKRDEAVVFPLDNGGQSSQLLHAPSLAGQFEESRLLAAAKYPAHEFAKMRGYDFYSAAA